MPNEHGSAGCNRAGARRMRSGVLHLPQARALREESGGYWIAAAFVVQYKYKGGGMPVKELVKLKIENDRLREQNDQLARELKMSDADWEIGKRSPRELAIKWLCRAVSVSSYDWRNHELLMQAIDRLIALDTQNIQNNGCC